MISNLEPSAESFLADLKRTQRRVEQAQRQISSGKRIQVASDDPDQIDGLLQLRSAQQRNTQIKSNLARAKTEADTAEQTLGASAKLLDRALVLASQSSSSMASAENRQSIALEVQSLTEQLVSFTRTTVEGRYIFSGDEDSEATYGVDWTTSTGVMQLLPVESTRRIEDPAGGSYGGSLTAAHIFDTRNSDDTAAPDNVFSALATLRTALLNNDETGIDTAISLIRQSSGHLNGQIAFYGSVQRRIQDAVDFAGSYDTRLQTELSQKQDADVTTAALELTQGNAAIQAAMQARAKLPRTSLFDFLG